MYGYEPTKADVREAMKVLSDKGVTKVVIEFSGGNDEGGADNVELFGADGEKVEGVNPNANVYEKSQWNTERRQYDAIGWVATTYTPGGGYVDRPATADEIALAKVNGVLEAPIYERYGSFAGEFYAHGTVEWDVAAGTHEMHGLESHEEWDSF